jgi:hypothetical protein
MAARLLARDNGRRWWGWGRRGRGRTEYIDLRVRVKSTLAAVQKVGDYGRLYRGCAE